MEKIIKVQGPMLRLGDVLITRHAGSIRIESITVLDDCYEIKGRDAHSDYPRSRYVDATSEFQIRRVA